MIITLDEKEKLLKKQQILNKVDKLKYEIANIPEQLEINKLNKNDSDDTKAIVNSQIHDLKIEVQRYKTDLDKVNTDKEKNNEKLAAGSLSSSDLNFLNADIERQSKRIQELNRKILEIDEQIALQRKQIDDLDNEIVENEKKIKTLKIQLDEKSQNNKKEILKLENEFLSIELSDEINEIFENKLSMGIAVATLDGNNMCSSCKMVQPPATIEKLKNAKSNELLFCEECDRILLK